MPMLYVFEEPIFAAIGDCDQDPHFVERIRRFLNEGLRPNVKSKQNQTPLMALLERWGSYGDRRVNADHLLEAARMLIAHGTDVRQIDVSGRTALTYVVQYRFRHWRTVLGVLQDAGATVGVMEASMMGDAQALEMLLQQGADPDASVKVDCHVYPNDTRYAIQYAAWGGHEACVRMLLNHGANPDCWNKLGPMPPTAIASAVAIDRPDILGMLLERGAVMKPYHGRNLLIQAVEQGFTQIARVLLNYGVDVNAHGVGSAIRKAASLGHAEVMRLLLEDPRNVSRDRWKLHEALWNAASAGHAGVVQLLLEQHAETLRRIQGKTPLEIAAAHGHAEVVELLTVK